MELNVSTGSSFNQPLLRVPVSKDSGGPMHVGQGCVTHLTDTVNTSILEKETDMPFWKGAIASVAEAEAELKRIKDSEEYRAFHQANRRLATNAKKKRNAAALAI